MSPQVSAERKREKPASYKGLFGQVRYRAMLLQAATTSCSGATQFRVLRNRRSQQEGVMMITRLILLTLAIACILLPPQLAGAGGDLRNSLNHKWKQIQDLRESQNRKFKALEHEADHLTPGRHSNKEHFRTYHSDSHNRRR